MQTYTGKKFWPLKPNPEDVCIEDIAHSLSLLCRYNGQCNEFYSVAQHSVFVSQLELSLEALLHDAPEAYMGDVITPLKIFLPFVKRIERNLERTIFQHFGIETYDKKAIKHADKIALYTETRDNMSPPPEEWKDARKYTHLLPPERIIPLGPKESEILFLERYQELTNP